LGKQITYCEHYLLLKTKNKLVKHDDIISHGNELLICGHKQYTFFVFDVVIKL